MEEQAATTVILDPDSIEVAVIGWFITVIVAIVGWLYNSHKNRQLQRKQIAILLLHDNRFEPLYVEAMQKVFYILHHDSSYDWKCLATKYFGSGKLDEEQLKVMISLKCVLNYFELVAVAVRNEAASEDVIRWSYEIYYDTFNTKLADFLTEARSQSNDKGVWINITKLAEKWEENPEGAVPTD